MIDIKIAGIVLLAFVISPISASAEIVDCNVSFAQCAAASNKILQNGNKLVEPGESYQSGWFDGYIIGILNSNSTANKKFVCFDGALSAYQISAVVAKYMQDHPEQWNELASTLVKRALSQAFPCKK